MTAARFIKETAAGSFREVVALYAQANLLQIMQCTACNALHDVKQRCCRWLLQTQDRVGAREFRLKQEFLAKYGRSHLPAEPPGAGCAAECRREEYELEVSLRCAWRLL